MNKIIVRVNDTLSHEESYNGKEKKFLNGKAPVVLQLTR